jgi:hypothetical protein
MTKNILYTTLAVGAFGLLTIGGIGASAHVLGNSEARAALLNKDFNGFKAAIVKNAQKRVDNLSQADFDKMSDKANEMQKINETIEKNDYEAFKKVANEKMLTQVTSQEDFNKLVEKRKSVVSNNNKIAAAIKNNNFDQYKSAISEIETGRNKNSRGDRRNIEEVVKIRFDRMVEQYKKDGTLPQDNKNMIFDHGMRGGRGEMHGNKMYR